MRNAIWVMTIRRGFQRRNVAVTRKIGALVAVHRQRRDAVLPEIAIRDVAVIPLALTTPGLPNGFRGGAAISRQTQSKVARHPA